MTSIRTKIFVQYIGLVLGAFIMIGVILSYFLDNYYIDKLTNQLSMTADSIVSVFSDAFSQSGILPSRKSYNEVLNFYSITANAHIIVFDHLGNIQAYSAVTERYITNGVIPQSLVKRVLSGKTVSETGEFNNFFDTDSILMGKPIIYQGETVGGVFCATPVPILDEMKWDIFKLIIFAMLISLGLAILLAWVLTTQITKPLKQINDAVKTIAKGDFEKRLNLSQKGEMHQLSLGFNKMADSLQNLEQMRKNFISNVSHELRTPMTIITGFLQGILDGTIPEEKRDEYISLVISETKRLTRLVNDLLEVARLESGSKNLTFDKFDIHELIRVALIKFESRIEEKNLDVRLVLPDSTCNVFANMDSIERVITNLIDNAVKFANNNGYICLSTELAGDTVTISVENSGLGISEEDLGRIWERFHKSDKSRSMDKTGVGLGLYIVKNILDQHKQKINVQSVPDQFTRFTFTLRLAK